MLELLFTLPVILLLLLSVVQLADITVASLVTQWAARLSARSAAVHVEAPEATARLTAVRALAPLLPPVPLEASVGGTNAAHWLMRGAAASLYSDKVLSAETRLVFDDGKLVTAKAGLARVRSGEPAAVDVVLRFRYPLRIPIAKYAWADSSGSPSRVVTAHARFPVMYAPVE